MRKSKKQQIYIFFIAILSALLVGMFFLMINGWLYKDNYKAKTSFVPGDSAVIHIAGTQSCVLSYTFDGAFISGEELKQNVSIKNDGEKSLHLRAKITIFTGENDDPKVEIVSSENWTKSETGYYYFNDVVESLNTVALFSAFIINEEQQLVSCDDYILIISVEGLSTEFDRVLVWGE